MANVRLPGSGELTRAQLPERTNTNPRVRHPLLTMDASTRRRALAWLGSEVVGEDFSVHAAIASAGGLPGVDAGWLGYSSRSALLYNTVSSNQSFFEAVKPALVPYELTEGYKHKFVRRVEYLSAVGGLRLPKTPTKGARPLYDEFRHSGQAFTDMFRFNVNVFDNKLYSYIENKLTAELRMPGIPWKVSPGFCTKDLALAALLTIGHDLSTVEMPAVTGFIGKSTNKKHTDMVVEALYQNAALQADVRLQFPDFREQADLSALVPDLPGCFGNIDGILNRLDKVHSLGEENKVGRKKGAYSALVSQAVFTPYGRCLLWAPGANCNIGDKAHTEELMLYRLADKFAPGKWLVGDEGYPGLLPFIRIPYTEQEIAGFPDGMFFDGREHTREEAVAYALLDNKRMSRHRIPSENGFRRVRNTFLIMKNGWRRDEEQFPTYSTVCFLLYNALCEWGVQEYPRELSWFEEPADRWCVDIKQVNNRVRRMMGLQQKNRFINKCNSGSETR